MKMNFKVQLIVMIITSIIIMALSLFVFDLINTNTTYNIQILNDKMEVIKEYKDVNYVNSTNTSRWLTIKLGNGEKIRYYNCKAIIIKNK